MCDVELSDNPVDRASATVDYNECLGMRVCVVPISDAVRRRHKEVPCFRSVETC